MAERSAYSGLLEGKKGLVVGVANQNSIAWACARALAGAGMECAFTYQGELMKERVEKTTAELGEEQSKPLSKLLPVTMSDAAFARSAERST